MLPKGLLRQAPTTHQPSIDFSKLKVEDDEYDTDDYEMVYDEVTGMKMKKRKEDNEVFVPEVAKRLARRTEAERKSVMSAYIERQEELRRQMRRGKLEEEESDAEEESNSEEWSSEEWEEGEIKEEENGRGLDSVKVKDGDLVI